MENFLSQMTVEPFQKLWALMALPPERLLPALCLLAGIIIYCELVRISLAVVLTRSVLTHVTVCLLTFALQAIILAVVLVHAAKTYPGRGFINLGIALGMYVIWYLVGQATKLIRPRSEGADLGFMAVGALITFPVGLIGAIVFH
ncbi:MAG TPA: hypothetical protein VFH68_01065 [Polyangia bacterium]|jgi:hypothetical protein|nr:hypothetical protein [Polyangia bacterium]